jgi:hypothetical protein
VATAEVTLDLSEAPFHGKDSWIVVRVGGTSGNLYPVMHRGGGTLNLEATSPEAFLSERSGIKPFAMTNAIYVDTDGDDSWKP